MVNKKICSSTYFGHNFNPHIINALRTASTANRSHSQSSRPRERSRLQLTPDSVGGTRTDAHAPRSAAAERSIA
ncbi:MAG: hypothetical protein ACLVJI_09330 [Bacilli bacterium]